MRFIKALLGYAAPPTAPDDAAWSRSRVEGVRNNRSEERSVRNGRPAAGRAKPREAMQGTSISDASIGQQGFEGSSGSRPAAQQRALQAAGTTLPADGSAASPLVPHVPASTLGAAALEAAAASMQRAPEVRPSSLPQPLVQAGQVTAGAGSGPGAPVSPSPAAPPPLRRVSSTPCPTGLTTNSMSSFNSSRGDEEAAAAAAAIKDSGDGSSKEGSRHSQPSAPPAAAAAASRSRPSGRPPTAGQQGLSQRSQSPPAAPCWHPSMGPLPREQATPEWARRVQPAAQQGPDPVCTAAAMPPPPLAIPDAPALHESEDPWLPDGPSPASSVRSVSLLTFLLKGPSAASSAAASREASTRSGVKRQPGGLSLALSRENSLRGGQQHRDSSVRSDRERSVRDGSHRSLSHRDSSHRSHSMRSGGGRQEGSVLAQWGASAFGMAAPPALPRGSSEGARSQAGTAAGCGSGEWMCLPPVSEMLGSSGALSRGIMDPFADTSAVLPPLSASEAEESAPLEALHEPHQVGSWAKRVTKFTHQPEGCGAAPAHAGGPDPLVLMAALEALATSPSSALGSGPGCNVLVGDSEVALTGSCEPLQGSSPWQQQRSVPRSASCDAGSLPRGMLSVTAVAGLACSWDAGQGAALPPLPLLGGSAPTRGLSRANSFVLTSADHAQLHGASQPLAADVRAAHEEWNRSFVKRWRAVKKRAYLQALGLRALWRVNSVSDRHEPVELLTNDLPQYDNGMRRAWSVTRLAAQREQAHRSGGRSAAQPAAMRRAPSSTLHKDPSLAALLLGEVAEVC